MAKKQNREFRSDMGQDEEEAKGLPKINHERAIEIAGNTLTNVLNEFDRLDRVSILQ
jgi:hypothetical protein